MPGFFKNICKPFTSLPAIIAHPFLLIHCVSEHTTTSLPFPLMNIQLFSNLSNNEWYEMIILLYVFK